MPGLADSRHAPWKHRNHHSHHDSSSAPRSRSVPLPPALLTVNPAPLDGLDHHRASSAHPPSPLSHPSRPSGSSVHSPPLSSSCYSTAYRVRAAARHELARYTKIVRRLQWKIPFLAQGYREAIARRAAAAEAGAAAKAAKAAAVLAATRLLVPAGRGDAEQEKRAVASTAATAAEASAEAAAAEAVIMFQLDYFEYYMLLERALVHLLGVFGISIPRKEGAPRPPISGRPGGGAGNTAEGGVDWADDDDKLVTYDLSSAPSRPRYQHRFHASVLDELDRPTCPLHEVLGTGDARRELGRAKDLRNRWKHAAGAVEEGDDGDGGGAGGRRASGSVPLESYNVDLMLTTVFAGFDAAYAVAEQFVRRQDDGSLGRPVLDWADDAEMEILGDLGTPTEGDDHWGFMVDAMDWEAV